MTKFKIQIVRRNGVWATLPDTEFSDRARAVAYADKYFARRYRIVEVA